MKQKYVLIYSCGYHTYMYVSTRYSDIENKRNELKVDSQFHIIEKVFVEHCSLL